MTLNLMKGVCLTRGKETFACSSQGFRNESTNTSINKNCYGEAKSTADVGGYVRNV